MTSTNTIPKNYNNNQVYIQLSLPMDLGDLIKPDDSVRLLSNILEGLDYFKLLQAYSQKGRQPVVTPKTMFKILVYAYMNKCYSTREIEKLCLRDINFMWLLNGQKAPDHNTISRFRSERLPGVLEDLFYQFIFKLEELGELDFTNVFIDGTKIEANANRYTFVWKKAVCKNEEKLFVKIKELFIKLDDRFPLFNISIDESTDRVWALNQAIDLLETIRIEGDIEFVYGRGKRKHEVQRLFESANELLERQKKYSNYNNTFNDRNSFSKTDPDATFMRMKDDHMKNGQLKPGYNVQLAVESEYIVGVDAFSDRSDQLTFIPFMEKLNATLPQKYQNIVADAGYESEENYVFLEETEQKAFIKPQSYETTKKKNFKNQIHRRENMAYDADKDEYICFNKKILKFIKTYKRKYKSGYESLVKVYECEDCTNCEYKSKCTKAKSNRQVHVSPLFLEKRAATLRNITTDEGIDLRINRSIQVEGAFGVLKEDYKFRRFLTRGKINIKTELSLLSFGYNMNKLHAKIQGGRCGVILHRKAAA